MMKHILLIIFLAAMLLVPTPSHAQEEAGVAIMPILSSRPLPVNIQASIYTAITKKFASDQGFSIFGPKATRSRLGRPLSKPDDVAEMTIVGQDLGASMVVSTMVIVKRIAKQKHMNFRLAAFLVDVEARKMLAVSEGICEDCDTAALGIAMSSVMVKLTAGPYPLGMNTDPPGAELKLGDRVIGKTPVRIQLPPGDYTMYITKEGYKTFEVEFSMPGDRPVYATLPLQKDPDYMPPVAGFVPPVALGPTGSEAAKPAPAPTPPPIDKPEPEKPVVAEPEKQPSPDEMEEEEEAPPRAPKVKKEMSLRRKWAWRTVGIAAATAAGGIGLTVASLHADDQANNSDLLIGDRKDYADQRDAYIYSAYAMYGLAGAATITALVLFFTEPDTTQASVTVAPTIGPAGSGIAAVVKY